ncbi:MAG TPA: nucleotidyltransferase family protein [Polyangia bacterium]
MASAPLSLLRAGLVQSLLIKGQRATLDEIGRAVGTRVLYLKAAWADPVLYGGRGERTGSDIDLLVAPAHFEAFAAALQARGFQRHLHPSASYERYFGHKEWSFAPPSGAVGIDLHRSLTEPIWYDLRTEDLIARARAWDSIDGPIWSLDAEDQIISGASH